MKILIIGGYGVFGGRLAELLSDIASLELVIGGRSLRRAAQFCEAYRGQASVRPLQVDRDAIEPALAAERPALVVDAARIPVYLAQSGAELGRVAIPIVVSSVGVMAGTLAGERILLGMSADRFRKVISTLIGLLGVWLLLAP